jgi:hypothetical protein
MPCPCLIAVLQELLLGSAKLVLPDVVLLCCSAVVMSMLHAVLVLPGSLRLLFQAVRL